MERAYVGACVLPLFVGVVALSLTEQLYRGVWVVVWRGPVVMIVVDFARRHGGFGGGVWCGSSSVHIVDLLKSATSHFSDAMEEPPEPPAWFLRQLEEESGEEEKRGPSSSGGGAPRPDPGGARRAPGEVREPR